MSNKNILITMTLFLVAGVFTLPAMALNWNYVYEADKFPTQTGSITDSNCTAKGQFFNYLGIDSDATMNNGTVVIDDTGVFGATNWRVDNTTALWQSNKVITVEAKLKMS